MRQCVVYLTNTLADPVPFEVQRLVDEGLGEDTFLALDISTLKSSNLLPTERMFLFDSSQFNSWGFATFGPRMVPGHTHFPLLKFYERRPDYDHYWLIEHDVSFSGSWGTFFAASSEVEADCLTCHLRTFVDEPHWCWWETLGHPNLSIDTERRVRSFNVAYRLSREAIEALIEWHRQGWVGHHEVLIATLLKEHGYRVVDMGGDGAFVPSGYRNRFYTSYSTLSGRLSYLGSIRYRPVRTRVGRKSATLYHPVKPRGTFEPLSLTRRLRSIAGRVRHLGAYLIWITRKTVLQTLSARSSRRMSEGGRRASGSA